MSANINRRDDHSNRENSALRLFLNVWDRVGILFIFLFISGIFAIFAQGFFSVANIVNVIRQVSIIGVAAVGMTMIIMLGLIDLSVGSIIAFAGIIAAGLQARWLPGYGPNTLLAISIVAALAAGAAVGFFNGFVSTMGGIHPFIVTLGTMSIFRGVTMFIGSGKPISGMTTEFRYIGAGVPTLTVPGTEFSIPIPFPVIIFLTCVVVAWFILRKTTFGRSIYAVGGNQEAAYLSGIMVKRVKIATFTILGALCGLSALILTSRLNSGEMVAGVGYELDVIAAVVIGGTSMMGGEGGVWGTLMGALLIGVISNGLNLLGVQPYWQMVVKGSIIILAVLMDRLKRVFQAA